MMGLGELGALGSVVICLGGGMGLLFVVLVVIVAGIYNSLVKLRNRVENAWAQIDVQLKRRYDLIPNLVETVKGYAAHEKETLESVIRARQVAIDAKGVADQAKAENMLTSTLRSIFALSESYPDLKANENFAALQEELTSTENKVSFARQNYNDTVMRFNTKQEVFPTVLVARLLGFEKAEMFEIEAPEEREAPKVKF